MEIDLKEILLQIVNKKSYDWIEIVKDKKRELEDRQDKYNNRIEIKNEHAYNESRNELAKDLEIAFYVALKIKEDFEFLHKLNEVLQEIGSKNIELISINEELKKISLLFENNEIENKLLACSLLVPLAVDRYKELIKIFDLVPKLNDFFVGLSWIRDNGYNINLKKDNISLCYIAFDTESENYIISGLEPKTVNNIYNYLFNFLDSSFYQLNIYNKTIYLNVKFV